jgi:putative transport protein
MQYLVTALREHPELALFLAIAVGSLIGQVSIGGFKAGAVLGCLCAGLLIGQLDIPIPGMVKAVFFNLFLFATGYKIGPQFFRALRRDALPQVLLSFFLCVMCLITAFGMSKLMGYDVGTAAGLLAGAFSESTVIGTAGEAIERLGLSDAEQRAALSNIPLAYAVTYFVGTAALVWYLPTIGPKLMGIDLKSYVYSGASKVPAPDQSARIFDLRTYRVMNPRLFNRTVQEIERAAADARIFVVALRRTDERVEALPSTVIRQDDIIAVIGRQEVHAMEGGRIGPEVSDPSLLSTPMQTVDVIITSKDLDGIRLADLAQRDFARGVFLSSVTRTGTDMPLSGETVLDRGDVLRVIGYAPLVERAAVALGYPDRETTATDMLMIGLGIFLGGLFGLLSVTVVGVPLTLTASGGALVSGLVFGWLRATYRFFGRIPEPAIWIFDTLGLCVFVAIIGISAGPSFISGLQSTGPSLAVVGCVTSILPHTLAILFGRYVLKMDPLIVLGACAGAGTITAALRAIQDQTQNSYPALGYTVPYAIGNLLLTAWGPVLVGLMTI